MTIRNATIADAEAIRTIYAPYVENTAVTFEYDVPTLQEMRRRISEITLNYPWLVAEKDGRIVGYAYAHQLRKRAAFQWSVETSIYLAQEVRGQGIGPQLYKALEAALNEKGIHNLYACIAYVSPENEYLTTASVRFHERMGYSRAAHFHRCGYKFEQWFDILWMERIIDNKTTIV
ncbi:MAG: GNAT family N-acetyltransferase [Bacteroidaceae bacterium]|nr:GNAT family N-acetyltransferase [Bacteroidaceae bacterium]